MYIKHLSTGVPVLKSAHSPAGVWWWGWRKREHVGIRADASRYQKDGLTAHTGGLLELVQTPQLRQVRLGAAAVYLLVKIYFHALPGPDTGASLLITSLGDE